MANVKSKTGTVRKKMIDGSKPKSGIENWLINTAAMFGISGSVVLFLMLIFWIYATNGQKQQFIDQVILWKFNRDRPYQYYLLVFFLVICLVGQTIYFAKRIKLKNERIRELEAQNEVFIQKVTFPRNVKK